LKPRRPAKPPAEVADVKPTKRKPTFPIGEGLRGYNIVQNKAGKIVFDRTIMFDK